MPATTQVFKKVLLNGLTILVRPTHMVPKVSTQVWYSVGSKHERSGQRGLAHLLEHMIFKGTEKLSESDINRITHKLSGSTNAFTSYDYTGYLFDFPTQNWEMALSILSDCMRNCTFHQEHLNSEMKAVIQELKMYKDNYKSSLAEQMISTIFNDHPYHYPIIGFKQDLWNIRQDKLLEFYQKHYVPNNATLVVVGDVDPEQVFALAEKYFGAIPADPNYQQERYYHSPDLASKNVTLYRDINQPLLMFAFIMPPASLATDFQLEALSWIIGSGKSSRLYQKLVDELQIATSVNASTYDLFDQSLFFIIIEPKQSENIALTIDQIQKEIAQTFASLTQNGFTIDELTRAIKQTQSNLLDTLEDTQEQAYLIGKGFLETGNENYLFDFLKYPTDNLATDLQELVRHYCRPSSMHCGAVLPLSEADRVAWKEIQAISDKEDEHILSQVVRETDELIATHVKEVIAKTPIHFEFPKATTLKLTNGLTILYAHNNTIPKIDLIIDFDAKSSYDPEDRQGLYSFLCSLMLEGTKNYPGSKFADQLERMGMSLSITPGLISMSMLAGDFRMGLMLLKELLINATLPNEAVEKVRNRMLSQLKNFWDTPTQFIGQLARQEIYKNHPYHKNAWGTLESITAITRQELLDTYRKIITPADTTLALVGDLDGYNIAEEFSNAFQDWQGKVAEEPTFGPLDPVSSSREISYPINRDQVVLAFCTPSVARSNPDFDKLLLYDQILTGGVLGSMHSRLFHLREQSGLFYTIGGSLLTNADEQPGMLFIKTIVSPDRLAEARKKIEEVIRHKTEITAEELSQAVSALITAMTNQFESNEGIARAFLFIARHNLAADFFDTRVQTLEKITVEEVEAAVQRLVHQNFITIVAGRI